MIIKNEHTPGPWSLFQQGEEYGCWGKGGTRVFSIRNGVEPMNEDARLIAAAPEMAEALHSLLQATDELMTEYVCETRAADWGIINDAMVKAGKLLARIEGKA